MAKLHTSTLLSLIFIVSSVLAPSAFASEQYSHDEDLSHRTANGTSHHSASSNSTSNSSTATMFGFDEAGLVQLVNIDFAQSNSSNCLPSSATNASKHLRLQSTGSNAASMSYYFAAVRTGENVVLANSTGSYDKSGPSYMAATPSGQNASLYLNDTQLTLQLPMADGVCVYYATLVAGNLLGKSNGSLLEAGVAMIGQSAWSLSSGDACQSSGKELDNQTMAFVRSDTLFAMGTFWGMQGGQRSSMGEAEMSSSLDGGKTKYTLTPSGSGSILISQSDAKATGTESSDETRTFSPTGSQGMTQGSGSTCTFDAIVTNGTVLGVSSINGTSSVGNTTSSASNSTANSTESQVPPMLRGRGRRVLITGA